MIENMPIKWRVTCKCLEKLPNFLMLKLFYPSIQQLAKVSAKGSVLVRI